MEGESEMLPPTQVQDENTFRILVATDIHLGYADDNPLRENDSFNTFDEILQIGKAENVDFVLLGGDLFHENRPKPATLHRAMEILRKHCLGSKPIEFDYLGDPAVDFPHQEQPEINFQNPDVNIALPVFTIHGNHDDPIGVHKTSAVDHLVAAKLLNHFGQWDDLNSITIKPVPLLKGETKLALYGLGNIKDERLYRTFRDQKVQFVRPKETQEDWFNIFVLHQNRARHGAKNYIPESFLPGFLDLAFWGHEHECLIDPEPSEANVKTYIMQPGSSVATSLCAGEAKEKSVGVLHINRRRFRLEKIKLQSVRPMIVKDLDVREFVASLPEEAVVSKKLETYVESKVKQLIRDSADLLTGHEKQPIEPLVRVRVFHEKQEEAFSEVGFSQRFVGQIVNEDIVKFTRIAGKRPIGDGEMDVEDMNEMIMAEDDLDSHVEKIVEAFFVNARQNNDEANLLEILSERGLSEAVKSSVEKNDKEALSDIINLQMETVIEHLIKKKVTEVDIDEELNNFRIKRSAHPEQESAEVMAMLKTRPVGKSRASAGSDEDEEEPMVGSGDEEADADDEPIAPVRVARGRGRGSRGGGRGRGRGRGKAKGSDDNSVSPPPKPRGGRATSKAAVASPAPTRGKTRNTSPAVTVPKKNLVQTTLQLNRRTSPRKTASRPGAMTFDETDSD